MTAKDKRIMGMDDSGIVHTWIVPSYAVHTDMRGQSGGVISLGHGVLTERSLKQTLNSKITMETEVIAVSDMLPHNILLRNFMEYQGYAIK